MILALSFRSDMAVRAAWLGFFALILLAWYGLYVSVGAGTGGHAGAGFGADFDRRFFAILLAMWLVMGAAMMLPTIVPTLRAYLRIPARAGTSLAGFWGLIGGYLLVWLGAAAIFASVQAALLVSPWAGAGGFVHGPLFAGALLVLAGVWQFTRGKEICQTACLSPMAFFTGRFRPGVAGAARMGAEIGLTCVGCCWAIMALGLVGGLSSLAWMGLATVFMVAEKLPEIGMHLRKPAGAALVMSGLWVGLV